MAGPAHADDWPQWMGPARDGHWNETGIVRACRRADRRCCGGPPFAAVTRDRPSSRSCFRHRLRHDGGDDRKSGPAIGHHRPRARVLCLDATTGKQIWKHEYECKYKISYPAGPRCTPTVSGGKVYTLGAEGNLVCLDAASGSPIWSKSFKDEYKIPAPIWGFAGHPLVDGQKADLSCRRRRLDARCIRQRHRQRTLAVALLKGARLLLAVDHHGWRDPATDHLDVRIHQLCQPGDRQAVLVDRIGPRIWDGHYGAAPGGGPSYAGGIGWKSALIKLASDKPAADFFGTARKTLPCIR